MTRGNEESMLPYALAVIGGDGVAPSQAPPISAMALAPVEDLQRAEFTANHRFGAVCTGYAGSVFIPGPYRAALLEVLAWQRIGGLQSMCAPGGQEHYRPAEQVSGIYTVPHWLFYAVAAWTAAAAAGDNEVLDGLRLLFRGIVALWRVLEVPGAPGGPAVALVAPRTREPHDPLADEALALVRGQRARGRVRYIGRDGGPTASRPTWGLWALARIAPRWRDAVGEVVTVDDPTPYVPPLRYPLWKYGDMIGCQAKLSEPSVAWRNGRSGDWGSAPLTNVPLAAQWLGMVSGRAEPPQGPDSKPEPPPISELPRLLAERGEHARLPATDRHPPGIVRLHPDRTYEEIRWEEEPK